MAGFEPFVKVGVVSEFPKATFADIMVDKGTVYSFLVKTFSLSGRIGSLQCFHCFIMSRVNVGGVLVSGQVVVFLGHVIGDVGGSSHLIDPGVDLIDMREEFGFDTGNRGHDCC